MTLQIRMTASCENEIVTLQGKKQNLEPQRTRRNTEENQTSPRRRGTAEKSGRLGMEEQPQIGKAIAKTAISPKVKSKNLETRRSGVNGGKPLPEQKAKLVFRFDTVPIWEMLRGGETHG